MLKISNNNIDSIITNQKKAQEIIKKISSNQNQNPEHFNIEEIYELIAEKSSKNTVLWSVAIASEIIHEMHEKFHTKNLLFYPSDFVVIYYLFQIFNLLNVGGETINEIFTGISAESINKTQKENYINCGFKDFADNIFSNISLYACEEIFHLSYDKFSMIEHIELLEEIDIEQYSSSAILQKFMKELIDYNISIASDRKDDLIILNNEIKKFNNEMPLVGDFLNTY